MVVTSGTALHYVPKLLSMPVNMVQLTAQHYSKKLEKLLSESTVNRLAHNVAIFRVI